MVTQLMSKSKLKTFGFANTLSKSTLLISDNQKSSSVSNRIGFSAAACAIKRPREEYNEGENEGEEAKLLNVKKSRVEVPKSQPKPTKVVESKPKAEQPAQEVEVETSKPLSKSKK